MNWWLPIRIKVTGEWLGLIGTVIGILLGFVLENYRNKKQENKRLKEIKIELKADLKYVSQILLSHIAELMLFVDSPYDEMPVHEQVGHFRDRWIGYMERDRIYVAEISKIFSKYQSYFGKNPRLELISTHVEHINDDCRSFIEYYVLIDITLTQKDIVAIKKEAENLFTELSNCLIGEVEDIFEVAFKK